MERYLELHVTQVDNNGVKFQINRQYHRGDDFCTAGDEFEASNGVMLISESVPGFFVSDDTLVFNVCGDAPDGDDRTLTVTHKQFALIMQAINEYNETDGAGYEKRWPQADDLYHYVNTNGIVKSSHYSVGCFIDESRRKVGNFFETEEEAKEMAEKFKSMLKGE